MLTQQAEVKVWEETIEIPTYEVGEPDKNPMFLEKRVYQGSSGRVYPHPVIDKIYDEKVMKSYQMVFLENEYVQIQMMPQIGGRIYRAIDKTNNYDFVYHNQVIKPALVGLIGPWISGGIEFNWPQHHRPNTYGPVEYSIEANDDGSKTVWVGEIDRMYGTKVTTGFTLYPGKAYLEIHAQMYNRTSEPQTFLWWANPALAANDHSQSVFPPDVHAVFDHGKRDVSKFPIATGTYYKMDYSEGVDISKYTNIPVPTSYMAYQSDYNFIGGYDHNVQAGLLHIANKHVSPGKKQWTWGHGEFGQAWDRNLTDEDGPYIELMTGVYTDNQPDFTWLQPYEEKSFKQYFMPYKQVGMVKNASIDAAVNLEVTGQQAIVHVYATSVFEDARVILKSARQTYLDKTLKISPMDTFSVELAIDKNELEEDLVLVVLTASGRELISYQPKSKRIEQTPDPAKAIGTPEELKNTEALYLAGLHLEQYRHATYEPDAYYLEGLKRDPEDIRLNNAYGLLLLRRGLLEESEVYFRKAIETLTRHNARPYDSEPLYNLGKTLKWQGRLEEALATFYKAVWSAAWQATGYFALAQIASEKHEYEEALELIDRSLTVQQRNYKARNLKSVILRNLNRLAEAEQLTQETIRLDPMEFGSRNELIYIYEQSGDQEQAIQAKQMLVNLMRDDAHNYIALAQDYADAGQYTEALDVLGRIADLSSGNVYPMVHYYQGYYNMKCDDLAACDSYYRLAEDANPSYCFPNSIQDYVVLKHVTATHENDSKAPYYLGNLLFDKKRHDEAVSYWEKSVALIDTFATVHRNLALAYFNKKQNPDEALVALEKAFSLNTSDARVFYELDQLYKKLNYSSEQRLATLEQHKELVIIRDDLYLEYITLYNALNRHEEAIALIMNRHFHPWEGGEGKVPAQYVLARVEWAKKRLEAGQAKEAIEQLLAAKQYPLNVNEGKLDGAQENNINYYLGLAHQQLGEHEQAMQYFAEASQGLDEPTSAMFYNDQPPHMIFYQGVALRQLGNEKAARSRFNKLVDYGEQYIFLSQKIDYFAVSLPDFLVFDEDLNKKNRIHCHYMMGLGHLGLGNQAEAVKNFKLALELDPNHQGAAIHMELALQGAS
ncbi:DUF5107 domain-containing protein [Paenibacillus macquariensis]|uniref:Flp pilus assembly protein TadD, contains TPR repeats n=1 Tax=Paenibacillus macquariensis TaxID=948756 RepID=A0ABY1KD31_9BACL|nr:DUF5107 domain-containing protein [Paenibacillus macquariensis]MEC0093184.1 DUF5107 domain-containing protein [Paenibacillus macquariensis]OAB35067.1 hypothetical protein PMSM_10820 [Paenibacillus macquariensis subsp. macquariensis]SIR62557.1 Flp pilus assembly protein TadD, contains TPR repeats [Paenibacillus macquariensis]